MPAVVEAVVVVIDVTSHVVGATGEIEGGDAAAVNAVCAGDWGAYTGQFVDLVL
jgi:hypothetical protein